MLDASDDDDGGDEDDAYDDGDDGDDDDAYDDGEGFEIGKSWIEGIVVALEHLVGIFSIEE